ncbi:unnamed protein product [Owenia fusiformis]|uniref:Uncharacterized protein n=1 Tax=Owenia fusiformis TaxID=6347 RepID=A0A8J1UNP3_OWEFU|nr:unnamed protein product [Owenia fusiformis]
MKRTLKDFSSNTTAHGWGNIHQRTTTFSKIIWIIICLGCTGVALWQVITIVMRYGLFETKDRIKVEVGEIVFPSVTVCPLIPIPHDGNLKFGRDMKNGEIDGEPFIYFGLVLRSETFYINSNVSQNLHSEKLEFYNVFAKQIYSNQGYFENFNFMSDYTHQLGNFIPVCSYQGRQCLRSDFHILDHPEYFSCFTFNGANKTIDNPITKITGPKGGLSLVLYLDVGQLSMIYTPSYPTSGSQGVRVVIHEKGTLPDPENDGFDIEPGHSINAALSVNERRLMKPPWGECNDQNPELYSGFTYTKKHCQLSCLQKFIYRTCGCIKSSLPIDEETVYKEYCLKLHAKEWAKLTTNQYNKTTIVSDMENFRCQNREFLSSDVEVQDGCQCLEKCSYQTYDMTLSQSEWPMKGIEIEFYCRTIMSMDSYINSSIYDRFHDIFPEYCDHSKDEDLLTKIQKETLRENFIRLNVYFKDLETKITNQVEDFTISSMISEIGGSLGFFVGMSIITIAEIILLCWNITSLIGKKFCISPTEQKIGSDVKHAWTNTS